MPQTRIVTMRAVDLDGQSQGLHDAQGAPLEGVDITFTLVDNQGRAVEVVDVPTGETFSGTQTATTDALGEMSIGLFANSRGDIQSWYFVRIDSPGFRDFLAVVEESAEVLPWSEFRGSSDPADSTFRYGHLIACGPDPIVQLEQRDILRFDGFTCEDDEQGDTTIIRNPAGDGGIGGDLGADLRSAGNAFLTSDVPGTGRVVSGAFWDDAGLSTIEGSKGNPGASGDEQKLRVDGSEVHVEGVTSTRLPSKNTSGPGYRMVHNGPAGTLGSEPPSGLFYQSATDARDLPIHTGAGVGAWVLVTPTGITLDQDVGASTLRVYAEALIAETGGENGDLEWGISTSDQADPSGALATTKVIASNTVHGGFAEVAAAAFSNTETVFLWARGNNGGAAFDVSLLGVTEAIGFGLYIPGADGGGGTPINSPLTTKGDLWGYSTTDDRLPVGADNFLAVPDAAEPLGIKWAKLGSIPIDPDDPSAGFPGDPTLQGGILQPDTPPAAAGVLVGYKDATGTQAADPTQDVSTPTPTIGIGDYSVTDIDGVLVVSLPSSGGVVQIGSGASFVTLDASDPTEVILAATGVPLDITSDTPFSDNGGGRLNSVATSGFRWPPAADAKPGHAIQCSNTPNDSGDYVVGVFDVNGADNPGQTTGWNVAGN